MNNITAILRQLEEGRLSTEEAAEKIRAAASPHFPTRTSTTTAWNARDARR